MKKIILVIPFLLLIILVYGQDSGLALLEKGEYEKAKSYYLSQIKSKPKDHQVNHYLGRSYFGLNEYEEAIDYFGQAISLKEGISDYHYYLAQAYLQKLQNASMFEKMRSASKVKDNYLEAIRLDYSNTKAHVGATYYYFNAPGIAGGSYSKAIEHANIVIKQNPKEGYPLLAEVYISDEEYDKAEQAYLKLLPLEANKDRVHYGLGMMFQGAKKYDKAFSAFTKAVSANQDNMAAHYQYGRTAVFSEKNLDKAISHMKIYLSKEVQPNHPDHSSARWRLGMLYELKDQEDLARKEYQTALQLNPENENAKKALADLD